MPKKFIFYVFFYIISQYFVISNSTSDKIIQISLENYYEQFVPEEESITFLDELDHTYLSSIIEIGSSSYPLKTFFNSDSSNFYTSSNCHINTTLDLSYKSNFYYNRYNSESFQNLTDFNKYYESNTHSCFALENFKIQQKQYNQLKFILNKDTTEDLLDQNCLYIGLLMTNPNTDSDFKDYNFIDQLKQKNYIDKYTWSLIFENNNILENKQKLIIGGYPHELFPEKYHSSQLKKTYSLFNKNMMKWELQFEKITCKNENGNIFNSEYSKVTLNPFILYIKGSEDLLSFLLTNFFEKYVTQKICHLYDIDYYTAIYCDKNNFQIEKFPNLNLVSKDLDFVFELNYTDLFKEKDEKYYFLIVFDEYYDKNTWVFGNIFFRKYQLIFDTDSKMIGFYDTNLEKKEEKNNEKTNLSIWFWIGIIILACLCFTGLGLYLGRNYFAKIIKKKRANELDEDYEYSNANKIIDSDEKE